jgi:hypothetical protein
MRFDFLIRPGIMALDESLLGPIQGAKARE